MGFHFVRFKDLFSEMSPYRAEVGLRSLGFQLSGDALFLRKIDNICEDDQLNRGTMLKKLAFISIVLNQFEYGLQCLRRADDFPAEPPSEGPGGRPSYEIFLAELQKLIPTHQTISRSTFASTFSFDENKRYFSTLPTPSHRPKGLLRRLPALPPPVKRVKNMLARESRNAKISKTRSPVERLLIEYGLHEQALLIGRKRAHQTMG